MRQPSARCLPNRVDLYRFTGTKDAAGGITGTPYTTAFATGVVCSVQPSAPVREMMNDAGRLIQTTVYDVMFTSNYSLKTDDKVVWVDSAGVTHNLLVIGLDDQAGRGAVFVVNCQEVV